MAHDFTTDQVQASHPADSEILRLSASLVAAYVGRNVIQPTEVAGLIQTVYAALAGTIAPDQASLPVESLKPAVPIKKSLGHDFIICLEDGKKLKMLKRHLRTTYNLTPDEYRAKWGLPHDYPMVAPAYAEQRSAFAKQIGLGVRPIARKVGRPRKVTA